jgi:hypothetical protein
MFRKLGIVCLLGIGLIGSIDAASALGPVNLINRSEAGQAELLRASFFGRPYPYGYTAWGPCLRYVEVETRWGPRLRLVRVCR